MKNIDIICMYIYNLFLKILLSFIDLIDAFRYDMNISFKIRNKQRTIITNKFIIYIKIS